MNSLSNNSTDVPLEQQAIRDKCFHPTGMFVEFRKEDVEQSIPDRFEEQVRRYPDRIAVKAGGEELSYEALNRGANRLAQTILAKRGEGLEPVAMLFNHGTQMIVALLGVLKARKFCVPLDASHPTTRIRSILEDSQASLIVTNGNNLSSTSELAQQRRQVVNIDEIDESISEENPGPSIVPGDFAAIVYTSGSTGAPKGAVHSHRSLLQTSMNFTNSRRICQEDRTSLFYSASNIAGIRDILTALVNGAALYPLDVKHEGVATLANWLTQEKLTTFTYLPSVFRQFISTLKEGENFPKLRLVHLSGETVYSTDLELYKKYFSQDCIFSSGLGCTEISPIVMFLGDKNTKITGRTVPMYPVEGVDVLLFDDTKREVGSNEVGEIAVKSRYLAQGYWNNPDLTSVQFLRDPQGADERIYLTGDLARKLPDGCLISLGRKDFQVKIRGYKVFLSEVEAALCALDAITAAVVVEGDDGIGNIRLVAYVTAAAHPAPTISELRRTLSQKLLDYMVPSIFVILDQLPLFPNGKVNRQALPVPTKARPCLQSQFIAPRNPVEEKLANIWEEVLDWDEIGVHDNFLELGGDSLQAGQVISRVINTFRVELALRILFEGATVADMAVAVVQGHVKEAGSCIEN